MIKTVAIDEIQGISGIVAGVKYGVKKTGTKHYKVYNAHTLELCAIVKEKHLRTLFGDKIFFLGRMRDKF